MMRALFIAASLLGLAGCADQSWHKASASQAETDAAFAACDRVAQRQAVSVAPHPSGGKIPSAGPAALANGAVDLPQETLVQQSLRTHCMEARGYTFGRQTAARP